MRIVVLTGGFSSERDVALRSGAMAAAALRRRGHKVAYIDMFLGVRSIFDVDKLFTDDPDATPVPDIPDTAPDLEDLQLRRRGGIGLIGDNVLNICRLADIVFLALHGADGEDGHIQALLDVYDVKYTGSSYLGSAMAMNKSVTKDILERHGITMAKGITLKRGQEPVNVGFPCVVKPCSGGSSIGTTIVDNESEYLSALETAFREGNAVVVEQYIKGRECGVGILGGIALPPIELVPKTGFFDFHNKYQPGAADEICPADFTPEVTEKLQNAAKAVFSALRLDVYARMDFIVTEDGQPYCLEANTLPGLTTLSQVPNEAKAIGISYDELIERIVTLSMEKYAL